MKKILIILVLTNITMGVATVSWSAENYVAGREHKLSREELLELTGEYEELKARHLQMVLDHLEPKAKEAGFVAVSDPHFVKADSVVGLLTH